MEFEVLPDINLGRTSFAAHYDFEDRYIYVVGGDNQDESKTDCEKFDVFNLKWTQMPPMNEPRANPGTFIDSKKHYLYAFEGFQTKKEEHRQNTIMSFERLDLLNENKGWELIEV